MWIDSEPEVKKYFTEQNMAQLLATRQVEIVRVPEYKEELTVTTSVYGMKPMFGFRNTFIYDAQGNPCYKTWSMGAFVDKAAGKLKRVDEATIQSMTLEPQLEMNYKDRRIILPPGRHRRGHLGRCPRRTFSFRLGRIRAFFQQRFFQRIEFLIHRLTRAFRFSCHSWMTRA